MNSNQQNGSVGQLSSPPVNPTAPTSGEAAPLPAQGTRTGLPLSSDNVQFSLEPAYRVTNASGEPREILRRVVRKGRTSWVVPAYDLSLGELMALRAAIDLDLGNGHPPGSVCTPPGVLPTPAPGGAIEAATTQAQQPAPGHAYN